MTAENATNHIQEGLLEPVQEVQIIPANPILLALIQSAKEAVHRNDFFLPTAQFTNVNWKTGNSWVVSPPIVETHRVNSTGERISWAGQQDGRAHRITTIGGQFSDTSFGGEGVSSILEIGVMKTDADNESTSENNSRIQNHCIYASGLPISPAGEMVRLAGENDFSDFDLIISMEPFARGEQGDLLLRVMVGSILQLSNIGNLTEIIIDESSEYSPRIIRRKIEADTGIGDEEAA